MLNPSAQHVAEYMSSPVFTVDAAETLPRVDRQLIQLGASALLVVGRDGRPAGVISRRDLLRLGRVHAEVATQGTDTSVELPNVACGEYMSRPLRTVERGAPLVDACATMLEHKIHRVFVSDGDSIVGLVSTKDVMRAVVDARLMTPLDQVKTTPLITVDASAPWPEAVELLDRASIGAVVVMEQRMPVGLFTEIEALAAKGRARSLPTEDVMTQAILCLPGETPLFRAAGFSIATHARRILVTHQHHVTGLVSGSDFVRAYGDLTPRPIAGANAG